MREQGRRLETREDYIEMVEKQYFTSVDSKDTEGVLDCFHPDAVFTVQSAFSTHEGRDTDIRQVFERLFERHSKILHKDFQHIVDLDGESCASQFDVENTSAYDGTKIHLSNCNFFYFRNDKFERVYVYMSGGMNTLV